MAYADTTPRSVIQGWGPDKVLLAADVLEGDLIGIDASNEWVLAQAATTVVLAMYVCGQDGDDGDTINVFRMAAVRAAFVAVAGEYGDPLYLSDTAGDTSTSVGTNQTQAVGWIRDASNILLNPRNPLAIDASDIANDAIDSAHYAAGSIDTEHIAADQIDGTLIADDVVDSEHYVASSIDKEHLADEIIGTLVVTIPVALSTTATVDTRTAFSPVAGTLAAVQFINDSGGAYATAAYLYVKGFTTPAASCGATLADGGLFRDTGMTANFSTVAAGSTLSFQTGGAGATTGPHICIVEIDYVLGDQ